MPSEVRQRNYGKLTYGPKMLNFRASKLGVKGRAPDPPSGSASDYKHKKSTHNLVKRGFGPEVSF